MKETKMKYLLKSAASTALIALGAITLPAQAATFGGNIVTIDQTLDITAPKTIAGPGFQGWQDSPAFSGGVSFDLAVGDRLEYTIDFLGNQSLTLSNISLLWAFVYSDGNPSNVQGTGLLQLLGAAGEVLHQSDTKTTTEGDVHFGQQFSPTDFASLPSTVTFYGLRYSGIVDGYSEINVLPAFGNPSFGNLNAITTRSYNTPAFFFDANLGGAVPEPATWAMLITGFGLVGGAMRRRSKVAVTYA
jgi:hypothetical protein